MPIASAIGVKVAQDAALATDTKLPIVGKNQSGVRFAEVDIREYGAVRDGHDPGTRTAQYREFTR